MVNGEFNKRGTDIFDEDWDNLIILDACRYDQFSRLHELSGQLESRISRGSMTNEFLKANFRNRDLVNTVYVTANPMLYWNWDEINPRLHAIVNVWQEDGWDEAYQTVLPETTTEYALEAAKEYPDKRFVVHYLQPHVPFLESPSGPDKDWKGEHGFWYRIMMGEVELTKEQLWKSYDNNFTITQPYVEQLLDELDGMTVVTSDHGNMIGERSFPLPVREWGHPPKTYTTQLVKIPWLVHRTGERRQIVDGEAVKIEREVESDVVKERLQQLGYH